MEVFMSSRFLRFNSVISRVGLSRPTLYRKMSEGSFPKPFLLDPAGRSVGFLEDDIDKWIDERIAARVKTI
jgi:prophage regulatory protein